MLPFNHAVGTSAIPQTFYARNYSFPMFLTSSEADSYYPFRMLSVYLFLIYISITDAMSIFSNTPNVILRIVLIRTGFS